MDHPGLIVCSFMENSIGPKRVKLLELEVLSLYHLYSLKTKSSQCHYVSQCHYDIIRFSVLAFRSDVRIELQAPVVKLISTLKWQIDFYFSRGIGTTCPCYAEAVQLFTCSCRSYCFRKGKARSILLVDLQDFFYGSWG